MQLNKLVEIYEFLWKFSISIVSIWLTMLAPSVEKFVELYHNETTTD